jgi:hypothetical protein
MHGRKRKTEETWERTDVKTKKVKEEHEGHQENTGA